jgi:cytochrome P450
MTMSAAPPTTGSSSPTHELPLDETGLPTTHPFDPSVLAHPFEFDRVLRREAPVHRDATTGLFLVSSYEYVVEALKDYETYSNKFIMAMGGGGAAADPEMAEIMQTGYPPVDTMLTADPPEHKRFRGLVNKAFTPRRVRAIADRIEAISSELIDAFSARGRVELKAEFAGPLPLTVIADQLGVPREDMGRFRKWSDGFVAQLGGMADRETVLASQRLIVEFQHYFAEKLEEVKRNPGENILSDLVRARLEGERPLDTPESLSILQQLLVAGNETTANSIVEGILLLVQNPDQLAAVRAEPGLIPNLVEEVLRLSSPTQNMWRVVTRDTELGGVKLPKNSMAMLRFGSANRDAGRFPDPDRFDVRRENAAEHLAFGHGIHFCIGAILARKEMEIAFRQLLERLDEVRLAPGAELHYEPNMLLRGLESLQLEFRS